MNRPIYFASHLKYAVALYLGNSRVQIYWKFGGKCKQKCISFLFNKSFYRK